MRPGCQFLPVFGKRRPRLLSSEPCRAKKDRSPQAQSCPPPFLRRAPPTARRSPLPSKIPRILCWISAGAWCAKEINCTRVLAFPSGRARGGERRAFLEFFTLSVCQDGCSLIIVKLLQKTGVMIDSWLLCFGLLFLVPLRHTTGTTEHRKHTKNCVRSSLYPYLHLFSNRHVLPKTVSTRVFCFIILHALVEVVFPPFPPSANSSVCMLLQ